MITLKDRQGARHKDILEVDKQIDTNIDRAIVGKSP